jgi:signal transduction histidine kinase/CheY-like chemotaxis protein
MAPHLPSVTERERLAGLLDVLEDMAGGNVARRAPISPAHDELDALAHAVNVIVGELEYASADLRSAKERAEEANRAKTVFLRNVSHEMRTPLSAIMGLAQLLRSGDFAALRRDDLHQRILSNGRLLLGLVDELLDLSKIESGKLDIDPQPMSVANAIAEIRDVLENEAHAKGLELLAEVPPDANEAALADAKRVRQILMNLVGNAIKFTDRGEVRIRLSVDGRGQSVDVEVSDTGIGLSPEQGARLFEPFTQADPSISRRFGGTGLGLALSRRLARSMGGDLAIVGGAPGKGTTLRLSLPTASRTARARPEPVEADGPDSSKPLSSELRGLRLLLAEDNPDIRIATTALLRCVGAEVVEAADGFEAVGLCTRDAFDVVLMDVRMPRLDGLEATRALRGLGVVVPIVALTADAVLEHRDECLAAGCSAHVPKPVDIDHLIGMIRGLVAPR